MKHISMLSQKKTVRQSKKNIGRQLADNFRAHQTDRKILLYKDLVHEELHVYKSWELTDRVM